MRTIASILAFVLLLAGSVVAQPAEPAEVVVLELDVGTRLRGVILEETPEAIRINAEDLGEVEVLRANLAGRYPAGAKLKPPVKLPDPIPPGLFGTSFLYGFDKSFALGINGREADNSELGVNASLNLDFDGDERRWRFRSQYFFNTVDGTTVQDEALLTVRRDWKLPETPPFLFAESRNQYDAFQNWQVRLGGFAGVGYALFGDEELEETSLPYYESERLTLLGRFGAGASYEFGSVNEVIPEALLAIEANYEFDQDRQRLRFQHTYFPSLDRLRDSRNVTEASWRMRLDGGDESAQALSLKIGVFNEYLSRTQGDASHNSLTYFIQLAVDF